MHFRISSGFIQRDYSGFYPWTPTRASSRIFPGVPLSNPFGMLPNFSRKSSKDSPVILPKNFRKFIEYLTKTSAGFLEESRKELQKSSLKKYVFEETPKEYLEISEKIKLK